MTDFKEGDRVTVITAPPPSPEATELAVTICRNNTEGIALALDRFAAAARERALEEAVQVIPYNYQFSSYEDQQRLAETVVAKVREKIRALAQPKPGETK